MKDSTNVNEGHIAPDDSPYWIKVLIIACATLLTSGVALASPLVHFAKIAIVFVCIVAVYVWLFETKRNPAVKNGHTDGSMCTPKIRLAYKITDDGTHDQIGYSEESEQAFRRIIEDTDFT